jgi:hypothetical protein
MSELHKTCIYCDQDSSQVPLIQFVFKQEEAWICPQHLPILIHKPAKLAGKLPGAETLTSAQGHDPD